MTLETMSSLLMSIFSTSGTHTVNYWQMLKSKLKHNNCALTLILVLNSKKKTNGIKKIKIVAL